MTQHNTSWVYATYGYDKNGNVATRAALNGVSSIYGYDALNRVQDISHPFTNGTETIHYDYDKMGNRLDTVRDGVSDIFSYDSNNQLKTFQPAGSGVTSFVYDANGNRTTVTTGGTTTNYTTNSLNQYTTVSYVGSATYDGNGNLASYNGSTYTYDAMNRLTRAIKGSTTANFYYDGLNRQVARTITGQSACYSVWDGWDLFAEYTPGNVWLRSNYHGLPGDLVMQTGVGYNSTFYYPDGLGNISHVAAGPSLVEKYTYDAYGTPTVYNASGTVLPGGSAYNVDHLFTGQQWHASLGFYDNRNRFYLPSIGRFLQPDPIGFSGDPANVYRYCGNNPANKLDSFGLGDNPYAGPFYNGPADNASLYAQGVLQWYAANRPSGQTIQLYNSGVQIYNPVASFVDQPDFRVAFGIAQIDNGVHDLMAAPELYAVPYFGPLLGNLALGLGLHEIEDGTDNYNEGLNGNGFELKKASPYVSGPGPLGYLYITSNAGYGIYDARGNGYYVWNPNGPAGAIIGQTTNGQPIYQGRLVAIKTNSGYVSVSGGEIPAAFASYSQGTANGYGGATPLQRLQALRNR